MNVIMKTLSVLQGAKQRSAAVMLCMMSMLIFMPVGCENKSSFNDGDEVNNCECMDELFYYEIGDNETLKFILGDLLLNERLLIGFDEKANDAEIVNYVNQTGFFKTVNEGDIDYLTIPYIGIDDCIMFVVLKEPTSCTSLKEIIQTLEKTPIVSYANLVFKGEKFTDKQDVASDGYVRVGSFTSRFYVKVKDANDLSDLYALAQETNTNILGNVGDPQWYMLKIEEKSKGNAMQMGNYFHEIGKFITGMPQGFCRDIKIIQ